MTSEPSIDPLLTAYVLMSEGNEPIEQEITLVLPGFLVSGYVISREKYMQHHRTTQIFEEGLREADSSTPKTDDHIRHYINLRDARFFVPGQPPIPGNQAVVCRFKLDSVCGFLLGALSGATERT